MENFFIDDIFCSDLSDLMDHFDIAEEDLLELKEDWTAKIELTNLEPSITLSADWICERIDDDRLDEDGDMADKIHKLIKENVDFSKVNELMPELHYPNRKFVTVTKKDLMDFCAF